MLLFLIFFLYTAHAWPWEGPQETRAILLEVGTWPLEPTAAPAPGGDLELLRRQNSIGTSVCGYVSGDLCE
jgi:hypothetical protein